MSRETERPDPPNVETIVIGSGFGGAVTSCRLAQAGFEVLLLERGRRYERHDFPPLPLEGQLLPDLRRWTWEPDQGVWDIVDLQELLSVQAAGYGGGSLLYANVQLRAPKSVFDEPRWPVEYREKDVLEPFYDLVASMLDIAPIDAHPGLGGKLIKSEQLKRAMTNLGREQSFFHPPLAVSRDRRNRYGKELEACTGCGKCCSGCPEGAKNTLDYNYLALAERYGARAKTQCEVIDIVQRPDFTWEVRCFDHLLAESKRYRTSHLFLCAGSVHSTRLLSRIRLLGRQREADLKNRVGTGYFPGGDALGVVYATEHEQRPSVGPTITTTTVHWNDEASFFMLQDGGYGAELERLIGLLQGSDWIGRNQIVARSGIATVQPSTGLLSPLPPREALKALPSGPHALPSPVDGVLSALRAGDANKLASDKLRASVSRFLSLLELPILAVPAVDRTIDGAIRKNLSWLTKYWPRLFAPEGFIQKTLRRVVRFFIRLLLASDQDFATRALRALLTASGLPPDEIARRVLGYDPATAEKRVMLLAMGRDAAISHLVYDAPRDKLVADLDLARLGPGYARQEQFMSDVAKQLGGELRTSPAWAFLGKPVTVHNQGGCPMSDDARYGVTDPKGRVHGLPGLYVQDGAILPTSVGVNPSHTIAAIVERNIRHIIENDLPKKEENHLAHLREQRRLAAEWALKAAEKKWTLRPPEARPTPEFDSRQLGLRFRETMQGYHHQWTGKKSSIGHRLRDDAVYREHETLGRPRCPISVDLSASIQNLAVFFEDDRHRVQLSGTLNAPLPDGTVLKDEPVEGHLELGVARFKPYGIQQLTRGRITTQAFRTLGKKPSNMTTADVRTLLEVYPEIQQSGEVYAMLSGFLAGSPAPTAELDESQQAVVSTYVQDLPSGIPTPLTDERQARINGIVSGLAANVPQNARASSNKPARRSAYRTRVGRPWKHAQRFMRYDLRFQKSKEYRLIGYKRIRDDGGLDAWRDTSTLFVRLLRRDSATGAEALVAAGVLHVDLTGFLSRQVPSFEVTGVDDGDPRAAWAIAKFAACFFGDLQRVYSPAASVALDAMLRPISAVPRRWPLRPGL